MNETTASPLASIPTASGDEGKYVYCIIKSPDERDFGPIGIRNSRAPLSMAHRASVQAASRSSRLTSGAE